MVKNYCIQCLYLHRKFLYSVGKPAMHDTQTFSPVCNCIIDLLPATLHRRYVNKEKMREQSGMCRHFSIANQQTSVTLCCNPVVYKSVLKSRSDVHALGKILAVIKPDIKIYGDSAYYPSA